MNYLNEEEKAKQNLFLYLNLKCTQLFHQNLQKSGQNEHNNQQSNFYIFDEQYSDHINDLNKLSENPLILKQKPGIEKKSKITSIFTKDKEIQIKPIVYMKNVIFIQQKSFKDLLLSVGNVDIFFYILELLTNKLPQLN